MKDIAENELLSAYVDDQLTPKDRAAVERLIKENVAARQVVNDFQAIRNQLHALPRRRVGVDLSQEVLRRAEQEMLRPKPAPGWKKLGPRFIRVRVLVWPSMALAAALLLSFFYRGEPVAQPQLPSGPVAINAPGSGMDATPPAMVEQPAIADMPAIAESVTPKPVQTEGPLPAVGSGAEQPDKPSAAASSLLAANDTSVFGPNAPPIPMRETVERAAAEAGSTDAAQSRAASPGAELPVLRIVMTPDAVGAGALQKTLAELGLKATKVVAAAGEHAAEIQVTAAQLASLVEKLSAQKAQFPHVEAPDLAHARAEGPSGRSYRAQRSDTDGGSRVTVRNEPSYRVRVIVSSDR